MISNLLEKYFKPDNIQLRIFSSFDTEKDNSLNEPFNIY